MDNLSKKRRSWNMSKVRSKDSKLEIVFRKELWGNNIRYRKNVVSMDGKPDLVFKKYKTVLFIDSCFWHKCSVHGHIPKSNVKFWEKKLSGNQRRDNEINKHYEKEGWKLIRIWEHDLEKNFNKKLKYVVNELNEAN